METFSTLLALWALMFSLICAWTNSWVNNRDAGDLRRYCAHYDVTVIVTHIYYFGSYMLDKYHTNCITLEQLRSPVPDTSAWNEEDDVMDILFGMDIAWPEGGARLATFNGISNYISPYPAQVRYGPVPNTSKVCPKPNTGEIYSSTPHLWDIPPCPVGYITLPTKMRYAMYPTPVRRIPAKQCWDMPSSPTLLRYVLVPNTGEECPRTQHRWGVSSYPTSVSPNQTSVIYLTKHIMGGLSSNTHHTRDNNIEESCSCTQ